MVRQAERLWPVATFEGAGDPGPGQIPEMECGDRQRINLLSFSQLLLRWLGDFRTETHLARLLITGKTSEETYERLRLEWQRIRTC